MMWRPGRKAKHIAPRAGMLNSSVPTLAAMPLHDVSSRSASTSVPASASACTVGRRTGRDHAPLSQLSAAPPSASSGSATSSRAILLCVVALRDALSTRVEQATAIAARAAWVVLLAMRYHTAMRAI